MHLYWAHPQHSSMIKSLHVSTVAYTMILPENANLKVNPTTQIAQNSLLLIPPTFAYAVLENQPGIVICLPLQY